MKVKACDRRTSPAQATRPGLNEVQAFDNMIWSCKVIYMLSFEGEWEYIHVCVPRSPTSEPPTPPPVSSSH